jgi:hypothetical protein
VTTVILSSRIDIVNGQLMVHTLVRVRLDQMIDLHFTFPANSSGGDRSALGMTVYSRLAMGKQADSGGNSSS